MDKQQKLYDKHAQWQTTFVTQFGVVNYFFLISTFSTIGFLVSYILDNQIRCLPNCEVELTQLDSVQVFFGLLWLFSSSVIGVFCIITRLLDSRYTARRHWLLLNTNGQETERTLKLHERAKKFSSVSWFSLFLQILFFYFGAIAIASLLFPNIVKQFH